MLLDLMGIILADNHRIRLGELMEPRALAAVPFGGRYRIIDTMLSSMVNSGIKHIGVVAETKYSSLMDHIGTGAHWDLDRLQQGLRIIPPYTQSDFFRNPNPQDITGVYDFIKRSVHHNVLVAECNMVANIDFKDMMKSHIESDADITVMYNEDSDKYVPAFVNLVFKDGLLRDVLIDPEKPKSKNSSLGVCVMSRDLLLDILSQSIARGDTDFSVEYLLNKYKQLKIRGYNYTDLVLRIHSTASYFSSSMRLLDRDVLKRIYKSDQKIYTKVKNEAPARYFRGNSISNSLISDGCDIAGTVRNSILFRGVGVSRHAKVENSIIMQDTQIMEGAELNNVIIDKDTIVRSGVRLQGSPNYPVIIGKGVIV